MPRSRWPCPQCDAVLKTAGVPAGKWIRCPKCRAALKVPADGPDDEDFERDEPD
jgi:uncharacterized paraquat-inducible protein A